jgi:hypothetical protein
MASSFKPKVTAAEAASPFNGYDTLLEVPSGTDPKQNAWLTIRLNVKLKFIDGRNPGGNTVKVDGKWYAKDWDGYLYPLLDWGDFYRKKFLDKFKSHAEKVWNWQFLLVTPRDYAGLDISHPKQLIRPNVLCLFRLCLVETGAHKTIEVANPAFTTTEVKNVDPAKPVKHLGKFDAGTFRSDSTYYDDSDLLRPYMYDATEKIWHDTIGHEIGHAIGQSHIMGLKGDAGCLNGAATVGEDHCYGSGENAKNIMGRGDRIWLENAVSWTERIGLHTSTPKAKWTASGVMHTAPRILPKAAIKPGIAPVF